MDCAQRAEQMWSPSGEATRMDDFRERVNRELQLTLSKSTPTCNGSLHSSSKVSTPHGLVVASVLTVLMGSVYSNRVSPVQN